MTITLNGTTGITTPSIDASAGNSNLTTLSVAGNAISAVNGLGFRNRIINGDMRIDQRNAGASVTPAAGPANTYLLDRWAYGYSQNSKASIQQSTTAPAGFTNSLLVTSLSAFSVAASDYFLINQPIEGFNFSDLAWGTASAKTVTISFWVRSSLTGTFGGSLRNSASDRSYPFTYTISSSNTWEQKSVTIAGDTTGTWVTNNGLGVRLTFGLGSGASFSGTAGAWAGANYQTATGATSVVGTSGATFYITGVQLEVGSVATSFERRSYGQELQLAQRYYYKSIFTSAWFNDCYQAGTSYSGQTIPFPTTMRSYPTIVADLSTNWVTSNLSANYIQYANANHATWQIRVTSTGRGYAYYNTSPSTNGAEFIAEL